MLLILSPAKTFKEEGVERFKLSENLPFEAKTKELMTHLQNYSMTDLCSLMKMSESLGTINETRFQKFYEDKQEALLGIHAFDGEAYKGLDSLTLSQEGITFAKKHLFILSGLYGVIRATDSINPYRLEMGTKLKNSMGKDLYAFWKESLTQYLIEELNQLSEGKALLNLASKEYSKAIDFKKIEKSYPVITIEFKEKKGETYKVVGMYAKRARGEMVRYILEHQIKDVNRLKDYCESLYQFNESLSTDKTWVFTR